MADPCDTARKVVPGPLLQRPIAPAGTRRVRAAPLEELL
jgi:hypothetical protein